MIINPTEPRYVAMIKVENEYYILATKKGLVASEKTLDTALKSLECTEFETRVIQTNIVQLVGKLFEGDTTLRKVKNYGLDAYLLKCNGKTNFEEIYTKGIKPYTIRDVAREIIKELSRQYLVKPYFK